MATIIIFASSFFLASVMVLMKAIELRYGKRNFLLEIIGKLDSRTSILVSEIRFTTLQIVQSVRYIVLIQTKTVCKNLLEKVEEKIVNEYHLGHTMIMGQKDIVNRGSVSFYLKKITEHKGNEGKGKIEQGF